MLTSTSSMRLEKPHSLSYHASTRTKLPGITLVWVASNVLEAGLWLKSIDTSGRVLTASTPLSAPPKDFPDAASAMASLMTASVTGLPTTHLKSTTETLGV